MDHILNPDTILTKICPIVGRPLSISKFSLIKLLEKVTKWKSTLVAELPVRTMDPKCAIMKGEIYLCFWHESTSSSVIGDFNKCMSASGPTEKFTEIDGTSSYPHHSNEIASNDRKNS